MADSVQKPHVDRSVAPQSSPQDRIVDVKGELMKFTLLTRDWADYLVDR
jgi:hypothetical protein